MIDFGGLDVLVKNSVLLPYQVTKSLLLGACLSQLLQVAYFSHIFLVVENLFCILAELRPLLGSALLVEIDIFPGPKDFDLLDMVEHVLDIDV